jgi:hypothetical protein
MIPGWLSLGVSGASAIAAASVGEETGLSLGLVVLTFSSLVAAVWALRGVIDGLRSYIKLLNKRIDGLSCVKNRECAQQPAEDQE